ncbi:hypothetical protein DFH09DRAFT_947506 [Mycena vulgaris]|nr:hypothetical protein DFH09DRAFT_947506 [Mycena vulgaris]
MAQFKFCAFIPPAEPLSSTSSSALHSTTLRQRPAAPSFSTFRVYVPPSTSSERLPVPPQVVPPVKSTSFKSFLPPPISSAAKHKSYQADLESGEYTLCWSSVPAMEAWIHNHEAEHSIELRLKKIEPNRGKKNHWSAKHIFICARMGTGGASKYVPKHPERERKIQSKHMACPCRLVAKRYPDTTTVLGRYENTHSHDTGSDNLIYTRIPAAVNYKSICSRNFKLE